MRPLGISVRPVVFVGALLVILAVAFWFVVASSRARAPQTIATRDAHEKGSKGGHKEEAGVIKLSAEQRQSLGIKVEALQPRVAADPVTVTGKIAANPGRSVVIGSRVPGRVSKVLVSVGSTVEAGKPLALIDSVEAAEAIAESDQAQSALTLAQSRAEQERRLYDAKLKVAETARQQPTAEAALKELAKIELGKLKQDYISALVKLEVAQSEYDREKLLVESKIGARKDFVRAEKELFAAKSEVDAVAEGIRLSARQELLGAEAALQQARSQRDKAREKLRLLGVADGPRPEGSAGQRTLLPLTAPFGGTVIEQQITEGQLVDPTAVLFRVADLTTVWAVLDVPESEITALRVGQTVVVEAGREGRMSHTGRVANVSDVVDEQTRTVKVRVDMPNPERAFKPGMFVTARIAVQRPGAATLMVPKTAVFLLDEGSVVFVESGGEFHSRPIELGPEAGGWLPVRKGLTAGENVVTDGGFALKAQLVKAKMGEE